MTHSTQSTSPSLDAGRLWAEREFDDVKGAVQALDIAKSEGWTVVSVKDDWGTVFATA